MSNDFMMGMVWALILVLAGVLICLVIVAVLEVRKDEDDPPVFVARLGGVDDPPEDPNSDDMELWLMEHTITEPFEANLLRKE